MINGPQKAIGKIGQGLSFDGTDDYVATANIVVSNYTLSAWIVYGDTGQTPRIMGNEDFGTATGAIGFGVDSTEKLFVLNQDGTTQRVFRSVAGAITSNVWTHVAATFNTSDQLAHLYINGSEVSGAYDSGSNLPIPNASSAFTWKIGSIGDVQAFDFWYGKLDDVRIYNRALSADEIKRLYRIGGTLKLGSSQAQNTGSLTQGLVGYWSFDESTHGTTSVADLSGNNNRGHLINGPQKAIGKIGQGLSFDGSNDHVSLGTNQFGTSLDGELVTISAWIRTSGKTTGTIVGEYQSGVCGDLLFSIGDFTANKLNFHDGDAASIVSNASVTDGTWHHVVAVSDVSNAYLYIDGGLDKSGGDVNWAKGCSTLDVRIGTRSNGDFQFIGLIDDVRIYNRALSASEIQRLYNMGR